MSVLPLERLSLSDLTGGDFLQSGLWGEFKSRFGWNALPFLVPVSDVHGSVHEYRILVLIRRFAKLFSLAYVPYPVFDGVPPWDVAHGDFSNYAALLEELSLSLRRRLPPGCLFIRWDLPWSCTNPEDIPAASGRFRKAPMDIQPPSTVVIDLGKSEDELLASMKSKTRYNIGLSRKKGVEIVRGNASNLEAWYGLYRETAKRDRIALHGFEYYRTLFELASKRPASGADLRLLLAKYDGRLLAGIIVLHYGSRATYLYGASSNEHRNLMPAYGLQWEAIRQAKQAGCVSYDLYGIPPTDDPSHPMAGLYRFKTGFGGAVLHRAGCHDFPLSRSAYGLYGAAETLRKYYHKSWKKRKKKTYPPENQPTE